MQKSKEELEKAYLEVKYLLSQMGEDVPQDIREQVNRNLLTAYHGLYVMLPAIDDLTIELKELIFTKYPEFKDNSIPHLGELVLQICDELANAIVKNVNSLLIDLENNNTPYIESEEQLQNLVAFFATPLNESDDQSPEGMEKAESSRTINNDKKDFLNVILKVLFRYFEESLNNLDEKGWQLIGIALGHIFLIFVKRCYVLMAGLVEGILIENPGISYKNLEEILSRELSKSPENEWLLNL